MVAILVVSLLLIVGVGRVHNSFHTSLFALLCLSAFVAVDPSLLAATWGAYLATFAFLFVAIRWLYPAVLDGVKPVRWLWFTPRFVVAVAYA